MADNIPSSDEPSDVILVLVLLGLFSIYWGISWTWKTYVQKKTASSEINWLKNENRRLHGEIHVLKRRHGNYVERIKEEYYNNTFTYIICLLFAFYLGMKYQSVAIGPIGKTANNTAYLQLN